MKAIFERFSGFRIFWSYQVPLALAYYLFVIPTQADYVLIVETQKFRSSISYKTMGLHSFSGLIDLISMLIQLTRLPLHNSGDLNNLTQIYAFIKVIQQYRA